MEFEKQLQGLMTLEDPGARFTDKVLAGLKARMRSRSKTRSMITLIAVMTAVSAAAAILGWHLQHQTVQTATAEVPVPAVSPHVEPGLFDPKVDTNAPAAAPVATAQSAPLLPLPVAASNRQADLRSRPDWALERAIERHPELVDGPERAGKLFVAIAVYADGRILSEEMRFASPDDYRTVETELRQTLPQAGQQIRSGRQKGTRLPDGRVLLNEVSLNVTVLPDHYDHARSSFHVAEVVRARHADLMVSATSAEIGRLFVLMSEDGQIQRESYVKEPLKGRQLRSDDPESVAFLAQMISSTLGVDVDQIGLMGLAALQEGPANVGNLDGSVNVSDKLRVLSIVYAWPRRAGESGPAWGQPVESTKPELDTAAALAIVERYMPDAFVRTGDKAVGQPAIVLTEKGKFIRSTRFLNEGPIEQRALQLQQLLGNASYNTSAMLKNASGQTADVMFVWEKADPGK